MDEVSFALEEKKQTIPVLYRSCKVPFRLRRMQYIDFTVDYNSGLTQLLKAVNIEESQKTSESAAPQAQFAQNIQEPPQDQPTKTDNQPPKNRLPEAQREPTGGSKQWTDKTIATTPRLINSSPSEIPKETKAKGKIHQVEITVAMVGLTAVLGAVIITNWDRLFPTRPPEYIQANTTARSPEDPPIEKPNKDNFIFIEADEAAAHLVKKVEPTYPPVARQARVTGVVKLSLFINKSGRVEHVELVNGHPLLSQAAIDAARKLEYRPFVRKTLPVEALTEIEIRFALN